MRVGLFCGSLGERSANRALLRVAAQQIEASGHEAVALGTPAGIPGFDPALVDDPPEPVATLRTKIASCDALLIAAPEYAGGVSGVTKNTLDWLVGDATIYRMVIGVASAGTTGGNFAIEQLVRTISWQGGLVVATLSVVGPRPKSNELGEFTDESTLGDIAAWGDAVIAAVDAPQSERLNQVASVVSPYGIDPTRLHEG